MNTITDNKPEVKKPVLKKECFKCLYWTGILFQVFFGTGHAYKCYCGDCPAKARDEAEKESRIMKKKMRQKRKNKVLKKEA